MGIKEEFYQATKGSSLFDYCIFNKNSNAKGNEKNKFLTLLSKALTHSKYFNLSEFKHISESPIDKGHTQVPFADNESKNEEYTALSKIFNQDELKEIVRIINTLKSYGVVSIKELMDNEEIMEEPKAMRSAFFQPFFSKKKR